MTTKHSEVATKHAQGFLTAYILLDEVSNLFRVYQGHETTEFEVARDDNTLPEACRSWLLGVFHNVAKIHGQCGV